jgi:hypothetical protein
VVHVGSRIAARAVLFVVIRAERAFGFRLFVDPPSRAELMVNGS